MGGEFLVTPTKPTVYIQIDSEVAEFIHRRFFSFFIVRFKQ